MAETPSNPTVAEPADQSVSTASRRPGDAALVEIAKIQTDGEYIKRDLNELRTDTRDLRERMTKLEVKVDHLPSKGFIVGVVTTVLVIANGLALFAPKLISLSG